VPPEKAGLLINVNETKALKIKRAKQIHLLLGTEVLKIMDSYVDSVGAKDGGAVQDVSQRIRKANGAFVQLYLVSKNSRISVWIRKTN